MAEKRSNYVKYYQSSLMGDAVTLYASEKKLIRHQEMFSYLLLGLGRGLGFGRGTGLGFPPQDKKRSSV